MKLGKKVIPMNQFTIQITPPETRSNMLAVNLYEDGKFNMNGKLLQVLGGKCINIIFTADCKNICLQETDDNGIRFAKNGSHKLPECTQLLKEHKIAFPAKYEVWFCETLGVWQGALIENPTK